MKNISESLEAGEYYFVNGGKKVLYWDGTRWLKPAKDVMGQYSGLLQILPNQPKVIKSAIKTTEPKT